jgi:hypothetical protein
VLRSLQEFPVRGCHQDLLARHGSWWCLAGRRSADGFYPRRAHVDGECTPTFSSTALPNPAPAELRLPHSHSPLITGQSQGPLITSIGLSMGEMPPPHSLDRPPQFQLKTTHSGLACSRMGLRYAALQRWGAICRVLGETFDPTTHASSVVEFSVPSQECLRHFCSIVMVVSIL